MLGVLAMRLGNHIALMSKPQLQVYKQQHALNLKFMQQRASLVNFLVLSCSGHKIVHHIKTTITEQRTASGIKTYVHDCLC